MTASYLLWRYESYKCRQLLQKHIGDPGEQKQSHRILLCRKDKQSRVFNESGRLRGLLGNFNDQSKFVRDYSYKHYRKKAESQMNANLKQLKNEDYIAPNVHQNPELTGKKSPGVYGSLNNQKLQLIAWMTNSVSHITSQWLAELLKPVGQNRETLVKYTC